MKVTVESGKVIVELPYGMSVTIDGLKQKEIKKTVEKEPTDKTVPEKIK